MSQNPAFLQDLTADTIFTGNLPSYPVIGDASLERLLARIGTLSLPQVPISYEVSGSTECIEYQTLTVAGDTVRAIVSITRNEAGKVLEVNVGQRPI